MTQQTKYSLDELLYMLEGDTTVMRGLLLENVNIIQALTDTIYGKLTYDELLDIAFEEF